MADVDFDEVGDYVAPLPGRAGRLIQISGALCSVALIVGMAIWGYKLAVRDVSGIPVVRAMTDPLRIAPENPGGEEAMHQGLSVNAVAAAGTVGPLPETLVLAPPELVLTEDDIAGLTAPDAVPAGEAVTASSAAQMPAAAMTVSAVAAASDSVQPLANNATATMAITGATDLSEEDAVAAALAAALVADPTADTAFPPGLGDSIVKTPRPPARPAALTIAAAQDATAETAEVAAASIAPGTRLVQLGAFDDEPAARAEWLKLRAQFPDLVGTKAMVVQPAESGGRTFFRLRAFGFEDEAQSREFCASLLAANASCIPVTQR